MNTEWWGNAFSLSRGKKKACQKTTEGTKLVRYFTKYIPQHITGMLQPVYHGASVGSQFCLRKPVNIICASVAAICLVSHTKYSLVVAPNVIKQNDTLP